MVQLDAVVEAFASFLCQHSVCDTYVLDIDESRSKIHSGTKESFENGHSSGRQLSPVSVQSSTFYSYRPLFCMDRVNNDADVEPETGLGELKKPLAVTRRMPAGRITFGDKATRMHAL